MQNTTLVWIIVGALVILGGGWYFLSNQTPTPPAEEEAMIEEGAGEEGADINVGLDVDAGLSGSSEEAAAPQNATVTYSANGFSPSTVTVRVGGTVTWSAQAGAPQMWVASAQHPTHSAYDGTTLQEHCNNGGDAFDQCANGGTFSFTFDKAGTWRYHNHSQASHFGTVIVEP